MVETDLDIVDKFLCEHFNGWAERFDESLEVEFESCWDFPEALMDEMAKLLTQPQEMYMRCLSHCLEDEYVALFVFKNGTWKQKD